MNKKVYKVFNEQVQAELYSAYMYLAMSIDLEDKNFKGMAHWMRLQYEEEREHAFRLEQFLKDRGMKPELLKIDAPPADYGTPLETFTKAFEHEQLVTGMIHSMYEVAMKEKDYAAMTHLHWFIDEQVEEEEQTRDIVDRLKMIGDNMNGLFVLDAQLGERK